VARFVFLENVRQGKVMQTGALNLVTSDNAALSSVGSTKVGTEDVREKMLSCLEKCLDKLLAEDRELILEYYRGEQRAKIERRSELTTRLGITPNALSIRACRIRTRLEACVNSCVTQT
jgi:DNA-directed RNA polymerase specialized sigma24 family protein